MSINSVIINISRPSKHQAAKPRPFPNQGAAPGPAPRFLASRPRLLLLGAPPTSPRGYILFHPRLKLQEQ